MYFIKFSNEPKNEKEAQSKILVEAFIAELSRHVKMNGRKLSFCSGFMGRFDSAFVQVINLPEQVVALNAGNGAEAENNRVEFSVDGFGSDRMAGKVKVTVLVNVIQKKMPFRAKTGTPEVIAQYLAKYINQVVTEVEPKFTHTKE